MRSKERERKWINEEIERQRQKNRQTERQGSEKVTKEVHDDPPTQLIIDYLLEMEFEVKRERGLEEMKK